jgi:hypothetical protein
MASQLAEDIIQFLDLNTTRDFLIAANKFIDILEKKNITKDEFIKLSHIALIDLYATGQKLQEIKLKYSDADSDFDDKELFENKNNGLIDEFAEEAFYWEVFDPSYFELPKGPGAGWTITDKEPTQGWLVDDYGDIYKEVKTELAKIAKIGTNEAIEDAFWQLKFGFSHHWGNHCIDALRYLHYYWYNNKLQHP